jgi:hypothetical protein
MVNCVWCRNRRFRSRDRHNPDAGKAAGVRADIRIRRAKVAVASEGRGTRAREVELKIENRKMQIAK